VYSIATTAQRPSSIRREIDAAPGQWGGRGLATAGWVLGILSIVYAALVLVFTVIGIASS
jgi:hypothetical protein